MLVQRLDVQAMVERKVMAFSVERVEEILRSVIDNELRMIIYRQVLLNPKEKRPSIKKVSLEGVMFWLLCDSAPLRQVFLFSAFSAISLLQLDLIHVEHFRAGTGRHVDVHNDRPTRYL